MSTPKDQGSTCRKEVFHDSTRTNALIQRARIVSDNRISQLTTFFADFEPRVGRGVVVLAPLRTWPDPPHCNAWYTTSTKYYTKRLQKYGVRHHVAKVHHNHKLLCITHYESLVLYTPQRTAFRKVCCDLTPRVCSASPPQPIIPFIAEHRAANILYHVHNHQDALKILFLSRARDLSICKSSTSNHTGTWPPHCSNCQAYCTLHSKVEFTSRVGPDPQRHLSALHPDLIVCMP